MASLFLSVLTGATPPRRIGPIAGYCDRKPATRALKAAENLGFFLKVLRRRAMERKNYSFPPLGCSLPFLDLPVITVSKWSARCELSPIELGLMFPFHSLQASRLAECLVLKTAGGAQRTALWPYPPGRPFTVYV